MRKAAWFALALAAACGSEPKAGAGPLDQIRQPTGMAVHGGRLLVMSSNSDLTYDEATGGALAALAPDPANLGSATLKGGVNVHSMGGELAVARAEGPGTAIPDAEACGTALGASLAVFGTRGSNTLNAVALGANGTLSCDAPAARCGIPTSGVGFGDPFGVTIACGGGRKRAYFGYLNAQGGAAWVGELNLTADALGQFTVRNVNVGAGPIRGLAYDRDRDRLFLTGVSTGTPTPLRWLNLSGCTVGAAGAGACTVDAASLPLVSGSLALELQSIALAHARTPGVARGVADPIRAYVTAIPYDASSAQAAGYRTTGFGSVLVVMDLYDDARGGVEPRIVAIHDVPAGAQAVRVLPRPAGWPPARRDVVAVVSVDTGSLTFFDDETGAMEFFGGNTGGAGATGAPILGRRLFGLAVDPALAGSTARVWVGTFTEGFVTPIDVTLDPALVATFAGGTHVKLTGATK